MKIQASTNTVIALIFISAIAFFIASFNPCVFGQAPGQPNRQIQTEKPRWMDGSGKTLQIKVAGQVLDENGAAANECKLTARVPTQYGEMDLPVVVEGNRFRISVPVGAPGSGLWLHVGATSADGNLIARKMIPEYEIRQAAIDGLRLQMKKPERLVKVTVVHNDRPVPDAFVTAEFEGETVNGKTNDVGIATIPLMNCDTLFQLTAWTNDYKIGGYVFHRQPPRDPLGNQFTIELDRCRPQTVRIMNDEDNTPVADLSFSLVVGTGPPNFQFLGKTPTSDMKTDRNGEAVYRWFPDWKQQQSYIEVNDPRWVKAADEVMDAGTLIVKVRKSQFDKRKTVSGRVTFRDGNVAGLCINIISFQAEEKNRVELLSAFSDEHGVFAAEYLPGAAYCFCVNDARLVSNFVDLIPYEPTTGKTTGPVLDASAGQPVEVVVTSGPQNRPIASQAVSMETSHEFSWLEGGKAHRGSGSRRWEVTTDEQGKAHTFALPGQTINGSVNAPPWQAKESIQVKAAGVTKLELHKKVDDKRKIVGRLLPPDNIATDVAEAVVELGSTDGEMHERLSLKTDADGAFSFESQASQIGIYSRTKDAKAAAVATVDNLDVPLELQLRPTGEIHGQLLGREDRPVRDQVVRASLFVLGKRTSSRLSPTGFTAVTFEAKTDGDGNYSLTGLPCEAVLSLHTDAIDGSNRESYLEEFYLAPNESHPKIISRLWKPTKSLSVAERYARTLCDCRISHFNAMVILFRPSDDTTRFVNANLMDYEKTREIYRFMQFQCPLGDEAAHADFAEFGRAKNWPKPEKGNIFACAIDATGKELGRIDLDANDPDGSKQAAEFIRKHAPQQADAKKKWDEAFQTAKQSNRKVWVRISERYCGPCFQLARWLDDHREILERDYVLLKVDDFDDLDGEEVAKRLTGSEGQGVPFHAIFDADARMLITSESAIGNIGYPSSYQEKKHLRKMLAETRNKITVEQIEELVSSLSD